MSYRRRLLAERRLLPLPLARVMPILSDNHKTGTSINLPVINCKPTKRCAAACYACVGPISWINSIRKALIVDEALRKGEIEGLIWECRHLVDVRLNGSGDMNLVHVPAILGLAEACPVTVFWGFTRIREVAQAINHRQDNLSLIISFDATSPDQQLLGYDGPLAFGPRRPRDKVPDDRRIIVVFPEHRVGHTMPGVPLHPKDCPATRGAERRNACGRCRRCWRPFAAMETPEGGDRSMNAGEDPGIQQRMKEREERKAKRAAAKTKAQELWKSMDQKARTGVRFGMFPAELMRGAESEGLDMRDLSQALMDCAQADGGMRA